MSYILDALRKSEQERLRGKIPDLNQFGQDDVSNAHRNRWIWLMGGAVLLVNVVGISVWLWRSGGEISEVQTNTANATPASVSLGRSAAIPSAESAIPATSPATSTTPLPAVTQPALPASATIANAPAYPTPQTLPPGTVYYVAPGATLPGQAVVVTPGGMAQGATGFVQMPAGMVQTPTGWVPVQQGAPIQPYPNAVSMSMPPAPGAATDTSSVPLPPPAPPPPIVDLDQRFDQAAAVNAPTMNYLPQLDELPTQIRSQIPDLTFSSHMYSSMARFRSVVINGTRVKEGQMIVNDIQVKEITETGVILGVGDQVFQVDVLGKWSQ